MKKINVLEKQVDFMTSEFDKKIREVTEKCIKEDGVVHANAIAISLARSFAASVASLTIKMSEKDTRFILQGFHEEISKSVMSLKKELA